MSEQANMNVNFDDGWQKVSVNSDMSRLIRWNPNDVGFVDRFFGFQDWVEKDFRQRVTDKVGGGVSNYQTGVISELGQELNERINECFGQNVSDAAFNGTNPLSPINNGKFLFVNFLEALFPIIEKSIKDFSNARKKYKEQASKAKTARTKKVPLSIKENAEVVKESFVEELEDDF